VRADPAVAQFAGAQLAMAEAALEQASAALQANEYASARRLAAQAALDARLAWGMTSSQVLRKAAMEVSRRAERLRWRGVMAAGAPVRPPP
jgi:IS5 family transposase